jgi:hypothetical protein
MQDPQTRAPCGLCLFCGGELYPGESLSRWEGSLLHPDCLIFALFHRFPLRLAKGGEICDHCGEAILAATEIRHLFSLTLHDDCLTSWGALQYTEIGGT